MMQLSPNPFLREPEVSKNEVELKFFVRNGSNTQNSLLEIARMVSKDTLRNNPPEGNEENERLKQKIKKKILDILGDDLEEVFENSKIDVEHKFRNSEYYDTRNLDLYKSGCSLRTRRRKRANYRIHVKTKDQSSGDGVFSRNEYKFTVTPAEFDYYQRANFFPFVDRYFREFIANGDAIRVEKNALYPIVLILKRSTRIILKQRGIVEYCIGIDEFRCYDIRNGSIRNKLDEEFVEVEIEADSKEGRENLKSISRKLRKNGDVEFSTASKYGFAIEQLGIRSTLSLHIWNYVEKNKSNLALLGTLTLILNNTTHFLDYTVSFILALFGK